MAEIGCSRCQSRTKLATLLPLSIADDDLKEIDRLTVQYGTLVKAEQTEGTVAVRGDRNGEQQPPVPGASLNGNLNRRLGPTRQQHCRR